MLPMTWTHMHHLTHGRHLWIPRQELATENITVRGPLAAIAIEDSVFWMGRNEFYVYTGQVQKLPCTVRDYVFDDFNDLQANKVTAGLNSANSEIWWFYPSSSSDDIDRYVVYNYQEKVWYFGNLGRTAELSMLSSQDLLSESGKQHNAERSAHAR